MTQYIDKSAVVAEIEKRIKKYASIDVYHIENLETLYGAKCKEVLMEILSFLDTLEVKEVDFKERFTWKPSVEQIIALRWVLNNIPYNKHKEEISGLLDQIKDL